jgi:hypothetical protein
MRPKLLVLAFAVALLTLALIATVALGDDRGRARAALIGYEETPMTLSSSGHGEFRATIDDANRTIAYSLTFGGLNTAAISGSVQPPVVSPPSSAAAVAKWHAHPAAAPSPGSSPRTT